LTVSRFRPEVLAARQRLAEGHEQLKRRHEEGCPGLALCEAMAQLRDEVVLGLFDAALPAVEGGSRGGLQDRLALVAHGGYGRREVAPFSDVDVMLLRAAGDTRPVGRLAERLLCDVFDAGLILGHSVRTPEEAARLACLDATIGTSLLEARLLAGSPGLFDSLVKRLEGRLRRRGPALLAAIEQARAEERLKFGETVYLLEPNVKRSRGGLRDLSMLRWIGMVRYGTPRPEELHARGLLSAEDLELTGQAAEFLLRLRNEMHFHAGRASDVLDRWEQVRIADRRRYVPVAGLLAVEQFMRDYFRHAGQVSHVVGRFLEKARSAGRGRVWTSLVGRRVPGGFVVGPRHVVAGRHALERMRGSPAAILELVELADAYDRPIAPDTWEAVRRQAARLPAEPAAEQPVEPEAARRFLALLNRPGRLGELLRGLHEVGLLERLIPAFSHARGLLQFNQYHKYTVDEHCIRAVEWAAELAADPGPLGRVYRAIPRKRVLHLAILVHDLGKGYAEDHAEIGRRIACDAAARLGLNPDEAAALEFLVHKHLLMNHLAFRRDTDDEQVVVRFAIEVGSPEWLQMLFVLTAADLAAIGPDNWTGWKAEILVDLYHRAMQHLAGESPGTSREEYLEARRQAIRSCLGPDAERPWFARQVDAMPVACLAGTEPGEIAADLRLLDGLAAGQVSVQGHYQPETHTVRFTIGTREDVTPGIFHKLTGALTGQGLEILSAQINTLPDGLVLDRFWVVDPDHAGEPPPERLGQVGRALVEALASGGKAPAFRRVWSLGGPRRPTTAAFPTVVRVDNATSGDYTILDVFAIDRRGLLYAVSRTIFELGLSVGRAKIGTFLDQVVDVFYVTDQEGRKIDDPERLQPVRQRLLDVIDSMEKDAGED